MDEQGLLHMKNQCYIGNSVPAESFLDQLSCMHRECIRNILQKKHLTMMELIQTCDRIRGWVLAATKEVILPAIDKYGAVVHFKENTTCPKVEDRFIGRLPSTLKMAQPQAAQECCLVEVIPTGTMDMELLQIAGEIVSSAVGGARSMMQEAASFRKPSPVQRVLRLEYEAAAAVQTRRGALRLESDMYGRSCSPLVDRSVLFASLDDEAAITADSIFTTVSMAPSYESHLENGEGSDLAHSVPLACFGKVFVAVQQGSHYTFPRALSCRVYQMLLDSHLGRISIIPCCRTKPILEKIATNPNLHKFFLSSVLSNFMERAVKSSLELFLGFPETPRRTGELHEVYGWIYGDGQMSSANSTVEDSSSWSVSSLQCRELEAPEAFQISGGGWTSFASSALENSSLWSVSSLQCNGPEALEALTALVVRQARDELKCRDSRQKGTASVSKRSNSEFNSVVNNPSEAGKVELTTVPQVSSHHADSGISSMCGYNLGSQDAVNDVRKKSSSIPVCPEEQKGIHVCDSCSNVGNMKEDEKTPSSPKVRRTKRFRLFSSKRHNEVTPSCLCNSLKTKSKTPSFFSRMSTALCKAFCFK
ncbi:hypothetical protein AALO_G00057200 [Alosa alosa]|uniref:Uncharacterized protein n=1 Tax=Alosa alosa TaxID=278164 RepID=A0AAV6H5E2_9TELE|nr:uncharacterized protein LOC125293769 [Alosa alosa]KAG5282544.1 hypothetical protein AALO_G00057200 [Alosa alosa]